MTRVLWRGIETTVDDLAAAVEAAEREHLASLAEHAGGTGERARLPGGVPHSVPTSGSAGCADCACSWPGTRPGDDCPSCHTPLLPVADALRLAHAWGHV